jgi:hypothetical protein
MLVLRVGTKAATPPTVTIPAGWFAPANNTITGGAGTAGADAGPVRATVLYRVAEAGMTAPSVALSAAASPGSAQIDAYSKAANETWAPLLCAAAADTTGSTTLYDPPAAAANMLVTAGDWAGIFDFINGDLGTATLPGTTTIAGATVGTAISRTNASIITGNQGRSCLSDAPITAGPSTAGPDRSITFSGAGASMSGATVFFRLRVDTATAPRLEEFATDFEDTSNTVTLTASVTIAAGDIIVVKASSPRGDASAYNLPTATGLTFTLRASEYTQTSHNRAAIWTAEAASALGATTITWTWAGASNFHSMVVERWSGAQLDPTPVTQVAFGTGSLPSTTITPEAANSVITMLNTDWVPTTPTSRLWVTTSASDGVVWELWLKFLSLNYWTSYAYMRAGAIGSKTLGMSAPTGQNWTILALELQPLSYGVMQTALSDATGLPGQGHLFYAEVSARWWALWLDTGTTVTLRSAYSADLATWTEGASTTLTLAPGDGRDLAAAYRQISGADTVHIAYSAVAGTADRRTYHLRAGISGTTISYSASAQVGNSAGASSSDPALSVDGPVTGYDSANRLWHLSGFMQNTAVQGTRVADANSAYSTSADTGAAWTPGFSAPFYVWSGAAFSVGSRALADLGAGKVLAVYDSGDASTTANDLHWNVSTSGGVWGTDAAVFGTTVANDRRDWGMAERTNTDVHVVRRSGASGYEHRRYNGTSWAAGQAIPAQASKAGGGLFLWSDGTDVWLFAISSAAGEAIRVVQWSSGAGTWGTWSDLVASSATRNALSGYQGGTAPAVIWTEGAAAPYTIKAASLTAAPEPHRAQALISRQAVHRASRW